MLGLAALVLVATSSSQQDARSALDPRRILGAMREALQEPCRVSYRARGEGLGGASAWPRFEGTVVLEKLARAGVPGRVAISGAGYWPGRSDATPFDVAFDGRAVRWLRRAERELVEHSFAPDGPRQADWPEVTGHFGRAGSELVLWEFLGTDPFARELAAETVEFEGAIVRDHVLCDSIYVERTRDEPAEEGGRRPLVTRWSRWLVGREDGLPRRRESGWIGDDGKVSAQVVSFSEWERADETAPASFVLAAPEGFASRVWAPPSTESRPLLERGSTAPAFHLFDSEGNEARLSDYAGRVVLLDFWSTSCVPCRGPMAFAQFLHERYGDRGLSVLGMDAFEAPGDADPVALFARLGHRYRSLLDATAVATSYRVDVLPTLYLIDREGRVVLGRRGFDDAFASVLEERIVELLD